MFWYYFLDEIIIIVHEFTPDLLGDAISKHQFCWCPSFCQKNSIVQNGVSTCGLESGLTMKPVLCSKRKFLRMGRERSRECYVH